MTSGGELFIVDNSEAEWKGLRYLEEWTEIASSFDIAAGYFEMGALLALHGKWHKLDKIRILMGDEISVRTRQAILESLRSNIKQAGRQYRSGKGKERFFEWGSGNC